MGRVDSPGAQPYDGATVRRIPVLSFTLLVILSSGSVAGAGESGSAPRLPPIVKRGSPAEALSEDAVVPIERRESRRSAGVGSLHREIQDELALPATDTGSPGALGQVRGLGRSAEEVDVQSLGISLNPAQGGGFDPSSFPQFLWTGYSYQPGPTTGGMDLRAPAGTLALVPWSAAAASGELGDCRARVGAFQSSLRLTQVSVGACRPGRLGVLIGRSEGRVFGNSGSASVMAGGFQAHLLGTQLDASTPGPRGVSPLARQKTARFIPVFQQDTTLGEGGQNLLKTSVFFDRGVIRYEDPGSGFFTRDESRQLGIESALLWGDWKWGASSRWVGFRSRSFTAPDETDVKLSASRLLESGRWLMEPTAQLAWTTGRDLLPAASFGIRRSLGPDGQSAFLRASFSRRLPSLVDRYYADPFFRGNPQLLSEKDWTLVLGARDRLSALAWGLELFGQLRKDAQAPAQLDEGIASLASVAEARVVSLHAWGSLEPAAGWEIFDRLRISRAALTSGAEFPYLPGILNLSGVRYRPAGGGAQASLFSRVSGPYGTTLLGERLPGYANIDIEIGSRMASRFDLLARLENLTDRRIELVQGYPLPGRTFALSLEARL